MSRSPRTDPTSAAPEIGGAPDLLALDRQVCFALAVASRNVIGLYRPLLEPMGLTHPQYLVMLALWEQSPLKVSDLAARLSLEPATLSPLLKRLEANGMVARGRDPRDDRALAITLTTKGRRARRQAERIPPAIMARLGMGLPEVEDLRDGLTRLIDAADREGSA
ncbi:MarR family winged helix-turn-helix transcriptional regulator [Phycicoccus sp. Root563]|uniref:MarR family winged helix-turn-helix transcriptional regulator n=1 Tax=Phycicoccus sp. Root563 TaxID=1736562 RepID=UPI000B0F5CDA|nr:MarR family transcriptional regulator [Phycicoccus sp. Root563]